MTTGLKIAAAAVAGFVAGAVALGSAFAIPAAIHMARGRASVGRSAADGPGGRQGYGPGMMGGQRGQDGPGGRQGYGPGMMGGRRDGSGRNGAPTGPRFRQLPGTSQDGTPVVPPSDGGAIPGPGMMPGWRG